MRPRRHRRFQPAPVTERLTNAAPLSASSNRARWRDNPDDHHPAFADQKPGTSGLPKKVWMSVVRTFGTFRGTNWRSAGPAWGLLSGGQFAVAPAPMLDSLPLDPVTLLDDGRGPSETGFSGRHVAQALLIPLVVVVLDEGHNPGLDVSGQEVASQPDAVLRGLVPTLGLPLGSCSTVTLSQPGALRARSSVSVTSSARMVFPLG